MPRIGVLALQGDVREHAAALEEGGAAVTTVRRPSELDGLDGLVIPGGESTAIDKLARAFGITGPLRERIADGFPVYGSCAGMILLADTIADPATDLRGEPQQTFGGLDMVVRRNAFGRQVDSFETRLRIGALDALPGVAEGAESEPVHAVFIRAPWVESTGPGVEALASVEVRGRDEPEDAPRVARIVAVRSGMLLATSFHPEVTGERRIHRLFIQMIRGEA
ncbi:pyridoxal 5'-phosphate synthase glutaminase subunit PdxT [Zafaria sp. Z1313]|uniref:pyridoxal 5'-phosphate synthase glutaminase subunit PdxT n=1 Tax=unclassified Zafaria TaxID=2828765 RepID=UPI002E7AA967|nr:pyridoxal 5'-phosphate synthase glutaminase subunit PdxT [Zafaria sp. J156]MEE1621098.1 pyridoxal 5'-phosphate synthase glutaminase subunit PdxT [Zafaria sp. J156]